MNQKLKNIILFPFNILHKFNPELTLKILFRLKRGYKLNLENPKTFNEKIQWIKLYYRNDLMPICADKYTVREFVKKRGSEGILNDLLWEGYDANQIPFDELPNQFVIKLTHGSGLNIICENKKELNINKTIKKLKKWLKIKYLPSYGEWFYGVIKPRIIIEKYLKDEENKIPLDYKIFCFDGEPKFIIVDADRFGKPTRDVYDVNWNLKEGYRISFPNGKPRERPERLDDLLVEARKLSKGFPHARVDFYIIDNQIYFGEITFTHGAGFSEITPKSFDEHMGDLLKIPFK